MRSTILLLAGAISTASAAVVCQPDSLPASQNLSQAPSIKIQSATDGWKQWTEKICSYQLPHMENPYQGANVIFERWDESTDNVPTDNTECKDAYNSIFSECVLNGINGGQAQVGEAWYAVWAEAGAAVESE